MKVYYVNLEVVDCTSDPHPVTYTGIQSMLEDVLKVCMSDVVQAIASVSLDLGGEEYSSDFYTVPYKPEHEDKIVTGPYARKHKIEGLAFEWDVSDKHRKLPIGLTGVKKAIRLIEEKLNEDPSFRDFSMAIGVVWDEFNDHNCSDYIEIYGKSMTVDYSNQDWYIGSDAHDRHLDRLSKLLGVEL